MDHNVFNQIHWKKNYNRKKVVDTYCYSMTFGYVNRPYHGYVQAKSNTDYPMVHQYLKDYIKSIDPNFKYNSITLNKNILCKPHKDRGNIGNSLIIGCGNYTGGNLVVDDIEYDIKGKPLIFDGSNQIHYNKDFKGDRYTVIYYNV